MTGAAEDDSAIGRWKCPDCSGEFPKPFVVHNKTVCPWCGKQLAKMFTASEEQRRRLRRYYNVE